MPKTTTKKVATKKATAKQKDVEKFYEDSKKTIKSWYKAIKGK